MASYDAYALAGSLVFALAITATIALLVAELRRSPR